MVQRSESTATAPEVEWSRPERVLVLSLPFLLVTLLGGITGRLV